MYKVKFEKLEVFTSKSDVEAVQFALSLHQASNVKHGITVWHESGENATEIIVCSLYKC